MKKFRRVTLFVFLAASFAVSVAVILAANGNFADNKLKKGQNIFGGYGSIHSVSRSADAIYPLFYDDTNIYAILGDRVFSSFDIKKGSTVPVCKRPLCDHSDLRDCVIGKLYDSKFIEYFSTGDKFYYYIKKGDRLQLNEWDLLKNEHNMVCGGIPSFTELVDSSGVNVKIQNAINSVEKINDETIMVYSGSQVYLFDNAFSLKDNFFCGSGHSFAWTDGEIFWQRGYDYCLYDLKTGELFENVLDAYSEEKMVPSSPNFYGYKNKLYFMHDNKIMSLDHKNKRISEAAEVSGDLHFSLLDGRLYYYLQGAVVCRDIESGSVCEMPDMTDIPTALIGEYLVRYDSISIELFDLDGRRVV